MRKNKHAAYFEQKASSRGEGSFAGDRVWKRMWQKEHRQTHESLSITQEYYSGMRWGKGGGVIDIKGVRVKSQGCRGIGTSDSIKCVVIQSCNFVYRWLASIVQDGYSPFPYAYVIFYFSFWICE